jgi:menaquinone-dependent protoporphyrinogen oxidase
MASICIVYGTVDGQTRRISECLQDVIESHGHQVNLVNVERTGSLDLSLYDKVVIGASIRYGRHHAGVHDFIDAHLDVLQHKPGAFFSVNIVARKPGRNRPETNPYVRKFLGRIRWQPQLVDVFAGRLDYPRYGRVDRLMIRLIMLLTHGPTDPGTVTEFTDWARVSAFAEQVVAL